MSDRNITTESLTKACYHLKLSKEYMDDFYRGCRQEAKNRASGWVNRLNFVITDVRAALTPEARERFDQEITTGDILFTQSISEKWIQLTPQQRELLETMAEAMIKGEEIVFEKV
mgnify:CR=1 FL=1